MVLNKFAHQNETTRRLMANFSELYNQYVDLMFTCGCKLTTDRELIKDCIHDVFVKFFVKHEQSGHVSNVKSYLLTSLRNRINDEYRKIARVSEQDTPISQVVIGEVDDAMDFEKLEDEMKILHNLMDNIANLPPRQQQIIHLYYMEQRKYDDICNILGINYQSVRNLMHRSIVNLRKKFHM